MEHKMIPKFKIEYSKQMTHEFNEQVFSVFNQKKTIGESCKVSGTRGSEDERY